MKKIILSIIFIVLPIILFAKSIPSSEVVVTKYPNGNVKSEVSMVNGIIDGLTVLYDENGNETKRQLYKKGIISVEKKYYKNGHIENETTYDNNGQINGDNKFYYNNGRLKIREKYRHGKLHGVERRYNEDGTVIVNVVWKFDIAKAGKCGNGRKLTKNELKEWETNRKVDCNSSIKGDESTNDEYDKLIKEIGD